MTAVLFDFNGTMLFDEKFQEQSWKTYLYQKTGAPISDFEFQQYIHGRNADITLSYFLNRKLTKKEVENMEEEKEQIYRKLCLQSNAFHLANGLEIFLDYLHQNHIPMNIATASGLNNVKFFFEHLHLDRWFHCDSVAYNNGKIAGKPAPDLYLEAAKSIGVDIRDCVVFEDSQSGIESAKRANAKKIVRVASMAGLGNQEADAIIPDYMNLKQLSKILEIIS